MQEKIYGILNNIAPTFHLQADETNNSFPLIIYYSLLLEPYLLGDNTYLSKRYVFNVDFYSETQDDLLVEQIENDMKDNQVFLRGITPWSKDEDGLFVYRFEFEIYQIN